MPCSPHPTRNGRRWRLYVQPSALPWTRRGDRQRSLSYDRIGRGLVGDTMAVVDIGGAGATSPSNFSPDSTWSSRPSGLSRKLTTDGRKSDESDRSDVAGGARAHYKLPLITDPPLLTTHRSVPTANRRLRLTHLRVR